MKQIEVSAKTVEEAVRSALLRLGVTRDEAEITVLDDGAKGLFGIGGRDARVSVAVIEKEKTAPESAKEFLDELIEKMGLSCQTAAAEEDGSIKLTVSGDGVGGVIGRRGETLDAIQYLVNLFVNKNRHGAEYTRVIIDSENYRAKREETLIHLANSTASRVLRQHRSVMLEPMNPYERRIIHSTLQANGKVVTRSVGEDPNRKIIVSPK